MRDYKYTSMTLNSLADSLGMTDDEVLAQFDDEDRKFESDCKAAAAEFVALFPGTSEKATYFAYKNGGFNVEFSSQEKEDAFFAVAKKYRM